jgi:hypothetical protein
MDCFSSTICKGNALTLLNSRRAVTDGRLCTAGCHGTMGAGGGRGASRSGSVSVTATDDFGKLGTALDQGAYDESVHFYFFSSGASSSWSFFSATLAAA